jgi:DNA modification methylase
MTPIELNWPGKGERPVSPSRPLEVLETVGDAGQWRNKLIRGDNLLAMEALLGGRHSLGGEIDLVYVDPPFATGVDFQTSTLVGEGDPSNGRRPQALAATAYRDRWELGLPSYLDAMAARLGAIYELLSPQGSLFVHLEPVVAHYVKVVLDEIFGSSFGDSRRPGFRNEIVWCYSGGGIPRSEFPRKHDVILWYSKGDRWTFNTQYRPYSKGTIQRGRTAVKGRHAKLRSEGTPINDWWTDVKRITSPTDPEKLYYDTQKSEQLLDRIVRVASNPGDLVADFFCGSGTTLAVAERLGRRWIGCDAGRLAFHTTRKRLLEIDGCRPFEVLGFETDDGRASIDAEVILSDECAAAVTLTGFSLAEGQEVPEQVRSAVTTWSDYVDFWAVDWDYRGGPFRQDWAAYRTRRRRELCLGSPPHRYDAPGVYTVVVKVTDVFGGEARRSLSVKVDGTRSGSDGGYC